MVTMGRSPIADTGTTHERVATPARCTVHAPQAAMTQPYLVPVIFKSSRSTQSSGVPGSAVTSLCWPFTVSLNVSIGDLVFSGLRARRSGLNPFACGGDELLVRERRQAAGGS